MTRYEKVLAGLTALVMALTLALSVAVAEESVPRVAALKGPTAMGMVKMMSDAPDAYDFTISAAIDEITPKLVKGEVDIAAVPANMASVLYNNTEGRSQGAGHQHAGRALHRGER